MNAKKILEQKGCIYTGHFVGVSTKHLSGYCNIDPLLPHVSIVSQLIKSLVTEFKDYDVDTVASPAVGAIPFSHWGAYHLTNLTGKQINGVWADKVSKASSRQFAFEREGFSKFVGGKNILILEDMINQMTSIKAMIETITDAGGNIVGAGSIAANRGVSAKALGVPKLINLCRIEYDAWTAGDCAKNGLCAQAKPIVEDIGHGSSFKEKNPDYKGGFVRLVS